MSNSDQMLSDVTDLGTVLGVWAHPDDECYLSAGLMAMAADHGARVVCVTATRGELGTDDPDTWPPELLGPRRATELDTSLSILGVGEHHWLDHADGAVAEVAEDVGVAQLSAIIDAVAPDTIVTFGPDGMTGHPDHVTVGRWATTAGLGARRPPRVLHAGYDLDLFGPLAHHFDTFAVYGPDGPPTVAADAQALRLPLDDRTLDRKVAALRAQESQTTALVEHMGEADYRAWLSIEVFVDAPPA